VAWFGSANEIIIGDIERFPYWLPRIFNETIAPILWGNAILLGGIEYLLAVFIRAGQEED
jgi:hypothetical protein